MSRPESNGVNVMKCKQVLTMLLLAAIVLTGCKADGIADASSTGLSVWLDQPLDGAEIPLAAYTLKAHASDTSGGGVINVVFLVTTVSVGSVSTDPTLPLVYAEQDWNPSAAGEYSIQAQAFNADGYEFSETAHICVGGPCAVQPDSNLTPIPSEQSTEANQAPTLSPTNTNTLVPGVTPSATLKPTSTTQPPLGITPSATTKPVDTPVPQPPSAMPTDVPPPADTTPPTIGNINTSPKTDVYYGSSCGPDNPQDFTVFATVDDQSGVSSVLLWYRYVAAGGSPATEWRTVAMAASGGVYSGYAPPDATSIYKSLGGANGYVEFYVSATDGVGNSTQTGADTHLVLSYCIG
jgi:hypothetical protein